MLSLTNAMVFKAGMQRHLQILHDVELNRLGMHHTFEAVVCSMMHMMKQC